MISGSALFSCHLAESLAERGHQVLVLAASDLPDAYCQKKGNLQVTRIQSLPNPLRIGQRFLLWPYREVHAALQEFQPQVIHLHDPLQLADIALAYARQAQIPSVVTIHAHPRLVTSHMTENPLLQNLVEKWLWGIATHLEGQVQAWVTPTQTNARLVEKHTRLHPLVISGGVDLNAFSASPLTCQEQQDLRLCLGIPCGARVLLHVGRLDPGKNVPMVIRAAAELIKGDPSLDVHLLVVGDGIEKTALHQQAQKLGISLFCHFPGYIHDYDLLSGIYRTTNLFLMASTVETQGLVLLEAAASGLPIVAMEATAIPEIVIHGVNGFLVPLGDVAGMARCTGELLRDESLSKRMGLASRRIAMGHDFEKSVTAYEQVYLSMEFGQQLKEPLPVPVGNEWR